MDSRTILSAALLCAAVMVQAEEIKASQFGFREDDATECLQKALKSGAKKIRIDKQKSDWVLRPVFLPGNLELVIDPGVTIRAKKGEFKGLGDALFTIQDVSNVTVSGGKGSRLLMNKADYQNKTLYKPSEWRHLVSIRGSDSVTVRNLILEASGGDGVYVSTGTHRNYSSNVVLENLDSVSNHRQGASIISCEKLRIRNCIFRNTDGTEPMAGIDFEPNNKDQRIVDCVMEHCTMSGNKNYGWDMYLYRFDADTRPISITVRDCDISSGSVGSCSICCCRGMSQVKGFLKFENCRFHGAPSGAVVVRNQRSDGFSISFANCVIDNTGSTNPAFQIITETMDSHLANFTIDGLAITDPKHKEWCRFESSGAKPELAGTVLFNGKKIDLASWNKEQKIPKFVKFTPAKLAQEKLAAPAGTGKCSTQNFRVRQGFTFLQYAKAGSTVDFTLNNTRVGKKDRSFPLEFWDPNGKKIKVQTMNPRLNQIRFTASVTGYYRFVGRTGGAGAIIRSAMPGSCFDASSFHMIGNKDGKLYFEVPAGAKDVMIRLCGYPNEFVTMRIFNHKQELMGELKDVTVSRGFRFTRVFREQPEVWTLEFSRMVEDAILELGGDLNPAVSLSPESLPRAIR